MNKLSLSKMYFCAAILLGLGAGHQAGRHAGDTRRPSSEDVTEEYAAIPCPSEAQYAGWLSATHFNGEVAGDLCDPKSQKGRLGRVFAHLTGLATQLPADWQGGARDALTDPLQYVAGKARTLQLDLSQLSSIAFNRRGEIYLGALFFTAGPSDSASTLVHESRHSEPREPGHTACRQGDIPLGDGGCDEAFSVGSDAGAYAYEVSFGYGVAAYNSVANAFQKEYFLSNALFMLSHRFNKVPNELAVPIDRVLVLDETGAVFALDALSGRLLPTKLGDVGVPVERIRRGKRNHQLWGFNGEQVFVAEDVEDDKPMTEYFASRRYPPAKIRDVAMLALEGDAKFYYLNTANELWHAQFRPEDQSYYFVQGACQPGPIPLRQIALAAGEQYYLGDDHRAYHCDEESKTVSPAPFTDPAGWRQLDGGLFYNALYGVNGAGALKYWSEESNATQDSAFAPGVALRYHEGISFRAALVEGNKLGVKSWDDKQEITYTINHPRKLVDLVVTRRYIPADLFLPQLTTEEKAGVQAFQSQCGVSRPLPGIWNKTPIGIDRNGHLVEYVKGQGCQVVNLSRFGLENRGLSDLRLEGSSTEQNTLHISEPYIKLRQDGREISLRPYFFGEKPY